MFSNCTSETLATYLPEHHRGRPGWSSGDLARAQVAPPEDTEWQCWGQGVANRSAAACTWGTAITAPGGAGHTLAPVGFPHLPTQRLQPRTAATGFFCIQGETKAHKNRLMYLYRHLKTGTCNFCEVTVQKKWLKLTLNVKPKKAKLCLCLLKQHAVKTYGGKEIQLYESWTPH
jgi:hypothetical protein